MNDMMFNTFIWDFNPTMVILTIIFTLLSKVKDNFSKYLTVEI